MADETTDGATPGAGDHPAPVANDEVEQTSGGASSASTPDPVIPDPPTEQWVPTNTAPGPRAYSALPGGTMPDAAHRGGEWSAATTPAAGPAPVGSTARFPTGAQPITGATGQSGPSGDLPPTGPEVVSSAPGRRRRGPIIAVSAIGVVLLIVIALIGSELYLRHRATDCLQRQFNALTGASTSVSLSKKPVLIQYFSGDIPFVQIDTKDADANSMRLHLRADGLSKSGDSITVGSLTGTGSVPFQRVIDMSKQSGGLAQNGGDSNGATSGNSLLANTQIDSVVGSAADGTVKVDASVPLAIFSVPISLTVKPVVNQGKVTFEVEQASAFAFGIPADFAQQFVDGFGGSLFGGLADSIKVSSLKVTDSGVDFAVSGSDVNLNDTMNGSGASCSVL